MNTDRKLLSLGDRMKQYYEGVYSLKLPFRMPVIIRLDGKSFSNWTRNLQKPFDDGFIKSMGGLANYLCQKIQTTQFAYAQSDEISLLLHNYKRLNTEPFFGNEIQKMVSISASTASAFFTNFYGKIAVFDARAFVLPEAEVVNYFVWRQRDAIRNSILMLAQSMFSPKMMQEKNIDELQEMMLQKGMDWKKLAVVRQRGQAVFKNEEGESRVDDEIPIFSQDKEYIERLLAVESEG